MQKKTLQSAPYLSIKHTLKMIDEPVSSKLVALFEDNLKVFSEARGSTNNHQAWTGGYLDHIQEAMNIGVLLYESLNNVRTLPFSMSDALVVIFCHDLEKPWKYQDTSSGYEHKKDFISKKQHHDFRIQKLKAYSIELTPEQENAVLYAEGELSDYTNKKRMMGPLAAFCHMCDITSARLWFNHPLESEDPWVGACRSL